MKKIYWLFLFSIWLETLDCNWIQDKLNEYQIVIVDSWYYKILARFLTKRRKECEKFKHFFDKVTKGDNVFMIDCKPEICWNRRKVFYQTELGFEIKAEDKRSHFISFQSKVRRILLDFSHENEKWFVINADRLTEDEVCKNIVNKIFKDVLR